MIRRTAKAPVSRDPAVVTTRILAAAQAEFMAHGYEAASTNRISRTFGGSKATLFRYFPTKEGLLEAVVRGIAAEWRGAVDWRGIDNAEPAAWMTTFAERVLRWILAEGPIFIGRLGIAEGHKFPGLEQAFKQTAARPLEAALAGQLAQWTRRGQLAVRSPRRDAVHFLDLVVAGPVSRRLYGERPLAGRRLSVHVARCVSLFLDGCRLPAGRPSPVRA